MGFAKVITMLPILGRTGILQKMKRLLPLLIVLVSLRAYSADLSTHYKALGDFILTNLLSAPFPHPDREKGHTYKSESFSAADHYSDNTVAIFVPKNFDLGTPADFVIHFHGWRNNVTNVLQQYELIEQLIESGRNAILVVPQGPRNAPDSFDGKLEDPNGFKRFVDDVMAVLRSKPQLKTLHLGNIILSGHSGGYQVISSILDRGGLTASVREVWLFDALYGRTEKFVAWFDRQPGRLLNIYTANGGTKKQTEQLMEDFKSRGVRFLSGTDLDLPDRALATNRAVFLFTDLAHDAVLTQRHIFRVFLETSFLQATMKQNAFVPPRRRDLPGRHLEIGNATAYVPDYFHPATNGMADVILFFHGASWCAEQQFFEAQKNGVIITFDQRDLASLFDSPKKFQTFITDASAVLAREKICSNGLGKICLASFSGGYIAIREMLKQPDIENRISDVVLADSLYAPRDSIHTDSLDPAALQPFVRFAAKATKGERIFLFSQLYPPDEQYRNNTTTLAADHIIKELNLARKPASSRSPQGNEIVYRADKGNCHIFGYAGMTTQDHFDHFYGLGRLLGQTSLTPADKK